ncbi:hypothetical protein BFW01_g5021 [Lasiodiplodia theobromae]|nr:hypothetical protein BFW01_g5021 [Lasiodiplodia theobromae]
MAASPHYCYFIASPDPNVATDGVLAQTQDGLMRGFYIKFGDGHPGDRYTTHNPTYSVAINDTALNQGETVFREKTYQTEASWADVKIGKWLERVYLKIHRDTRKEWYFVYVKVAERPDDPNFDLNQLRSLLIDILNEFPAYDTWEQDESYESCELDRLFTTFYCNCDW